jgi:hypothetical protein
VTTAKLATRRRWQRRVLWATGLGALLTLGLAGAFHRPLFSRLVTELAFRDASEMASRMSGGPGKKDVIGADFERSIAPLVQSYGRYFRWGYFDRNYFVERSPVSGLTPEAIPPVLVVGAFYKANDQRFLTPEGRVNEEAIFGEFLEWLDSVLLRPGPKEVLVNLLAADYTALVLKADQGAGIVKAGIFEWLFVRGASGPVPKVPGDLEQWSKRCKAALGPKHWQAILRDCDHPREKVRAGSLLLLCHHPVEEVFREKARAALEDPSAWVRLAAAGTLALRGDGTGAQHLISGLRHERWEVRWWCGVGLSALGDRDYTQALETRRQVEPDRWLRQEMGNMIRDRERWQGRK